MNLINSLINGEINKRGPKWYVKGKEKKLKRRKGVTLHGLGELVGFTSINGRLSN